MSTGRTTPDLSNLVDSFDSDACSKTEQLRRMIEQSQLELQTLLLWESNESLKGKASVTEWSSNSTASEDSTFARIRCANGWELAFSFSRFQFHGGSNVNKKSKSKERRVKEICQLCREGDVCVVYSVQIIRNDDGKRGTEAEDVIRICLGVQDGDFSFRKGFHNDIHFICDSDGGASSSNSGISVGEGGEGGEGGGGADGDDGGDTNGDENSASGGAGGGGEEEESAGGREGRPCKKARMSSSSSISSSSSSSTSPSPSANKRKNVCFIPAPTLMGGLESMSDLMNDLGISNGNGNRSDEEGSEGETSRGIDEVVDFALSFPYCNKCEYDLARFIYQYMLGYDSDDDELCGGGESDTSDGDGRSDDDEDDEELIAMESIDKEEEDDLVGTCEMVD